MGENPRSAKAVLTLFSQEKLRALLVLDLELRPFLLNAAIATLDHVVDRHVAGFKHGIKVEGRGSGGMHCARDSEGFPAAIASRLNL